MSSLNSMRQDTEQIIGEWAKSVTIKRLSVSYNERGEPSPQWETVLQNGSETVDCDIQPVSGEIEREEQGVKVRYSHQAFFPYGTDIRPNDRIYRAADDYLVVCRVDEHDDHTFVYAQEPER